MQAGAVKRTRRAADEYADSGDYESATREVFQTDPELSDRYQQRGERTATQAYEREVAPMVAQGNYQGAIDTAAQAGRPDQVVNFQEMMRNATTEQRAEAQRQLELQTRALVGIAELTDPAQAQAAYTQWRATVPESARANVPEQYSVGYVRRRLREAMDINQILTEEHRQRQHGETVRHNQAMEGVAATRAQGGGERRESALRAEFTRQQGEFVAVRDSYQQIQQISAGTPSPGGDIALVFSFMKMLDPGSVVRESEYATAANAAGVPDQVRNLYNRLQSGERLNSTQRRDFTSQAEQVYQARLRTHQRDSDSYRRLAADYGFDPDNVVLDMEAMTGGDVVEVSTPAEAEALPPGTIYRTPDGREYER